MAVAWGRTTCAGDARRFRDAVVARWACRPLVALDALGIYLRREQGGKVEVSIFWVLISFVIGFALGYEETLAKKEKKKKRDAEDE